MSQQTEVWYHGTSETAAVGILVDGFNHVHNWFAVNVENARRFGGPVVLQVEFEAELIPVDENGARWQMCVHENIPPERVKRLEEQNVDR